MKHLRRLLFVIVSTSVGVAFATLYTGVAAAERPDTTAVDQSDREMPTLRPLSADDLRLVLKVVPELEAVETRLMRPSQTVKYVEFDKFVELMEATPEVKKVLDKYSVSAADFFRVLDTTIRAFRGAANIDRVSGDVMRANVALVVNPPEDIALALIEWRRSRLGF